MGDAAGLCIAFFTPDPGKFCERCLLAMVFHSN
jgi:hypothetical protein